MVVVLQPIRHDGFGVPGEVLCDTVTERPSIPLILDQVVVLGTNSTTMIAAQGLAESTVSLRLESSNTIRIVGVGSEGHVSVNGRLINSRKASFLNVGDELSLHSPDRAYDYKVVIADGDPTVAVHAASSVPSTPSSPVTSAAAAASAAASSLSQVAEEFACAICLDLQVQSTTLVPCGHSFCKSCIATGDFGHAFFKPPSQRTPQVCSICTTAATAIVPCRTLDNVIAALVSTNQVFSADDAQVYRDRMKKVSGAAAAAPTRTPKKRKKYSPKRRRGSGGSASTTSHHEVISNLAIGAPIESVLPVLTGASASDAICID